MAPSARPVVSAGAARRQVGAAVPFAASNPGGSRVRGGTSALCPLPGAEPGRHRGSEAASRPRFGTNRFLRKQRADRLTSAESGFFFYFLFSPFGQESAVSQGLNGRFFPLFLIFLLGKLQPGRQQRALRTPHMPARGKAARALRQSALQKCSFGCVFWKSKIYLIICGVLPMPP